MMTADETAELARVLPLADGARVLAASQGGWVALEKPPGVLTHPNGPNEPDATLLVAGYDPRHERYHWEPAAPGAPGTLYLVNRLDSPTSGVVLGALTEAAALGARQAFAEGRAHKTYVALVMGRPNPAAGEWRDHLVRDAPGQPGRRGVRVAVRGRPGGGESRTALTRYFCVETNGADGGARPSLTLLRLEPVTGRTHQLRVQCATHRHPIIGDRTYGDFSFNRDFSRRTGCKRLFLHATHLELASLGFAAESPLPAEFYSALQAGG